MRLKLGDEFAHRFVNQVEKTSMKLARAGIDHLQLQSAHNILEIGCGGGGAGREILFNLKRTHSEAKLTLSDISGEMIKIANSQFSESELSDPNLSIIQADLKTPFSDASFDRILVVLT